MSRIKNLNYWVIGTTLVLFNGTVIIDILLKGFNRIISFFAADAFYYFTIARNYAQYGFYSFDQFYPTNGFHPLWQFILGFLFKTLSLFNTSEESYLIIIIFVNLFIISLAIIILGKCFILFNGRVPLFFILLPVGLYGLIIAPVSPQYGTLWSFVNGMESGLTILFYAILMWLTIKTEFITKPNIKSSLLIGCILGLVFLSRLDHAFLAVAFLGSATICYLVSKHYQKISYLVLSGSIVALTLFAYLVFNYFTVGTFMPVSAISKSTFPYPVFDKVYEIISLIKNLQQAWDVHIIWRLAQLNFPAMIAFIGLFVIFRSCKRDKNQDARLFILEVNVVFVLLIWAYNFFFVPLWDQGHWYYPVSILFVSLFTFYLVDKWISKHLYNRATMMILLLLGILYFYQVYRSEGYNQKFANLFNQRNEIRAFYYQSEKPKIIEFDDGIVAYTTGFPAMSGLGFALDKEALLEKKNGNLLEVAMKRGFTHISTLQYFSAKELNLDMSSEDIHKEINDSILDIPGLDEFDLKVEYLSHDGEFAIISIMPR